MKNSGWVIVITLHDEADANMIMGLFEERNIEFKYDDSWDKNAKQDTLYSNEIKIYVREPQVDAAKAIIEESKDMIKGD